MPKNWKTVKQIAHEWRVGERTVRRWCASGEIRCTRVGGEWRVSWPQQAPDLSAKSQTANSAKLANSANTAI